MRNKKVPAKIEPSFTKRDVLFKKIEAVIKKETLTAIGDICNYIAISRQTIYYNFPVGSAEMNYFSELLDNNKSLTKETLRKRWLESDSPALQIALYKLMANTEERAALTNSNLIITQDPLEAEVNQDEIGRVPLDVLQRFIAANMKSGTPPAPTYVDFEESGTGGESGGKLGESDASIADDPENIED